MITHVAIRDLALIESLEIEFAAGFNVITGETGAGKSILIRALNFLMGGKAGSESVRKGKSEASVVGSFWVPHGHPSLLLLENLGVPVEESDGGVSILVRRHLSAKGRSQAWINDTSVTSHALKELASFLIDIFAQHENQRLLNPDSHIHYLDKFLDEPAALDYYAIVFQRVTERVRDLRDLTEKFQESVRTEDYMQFRLKELDDFEPDAADYDELKEFVRVAERQLKDKDRIGEAVLALDGAEGERGIAPRIWDVAKRLKRLVESGSDDSAFMALAEKLESAASEVEAVSFELSRFFSGSSIDDTNVEAAQGRLFEYHDLFRKLSVTTAEALAELRVNWKRELDFLSSGAEQARTLVQALESDLAELEAQSVRLSALRKSAGVRIKRRIEDELHALAMPGSSLEVELTPIVRSVPDIDGILGGDAIKRAWLKCRERLQCLDNQAGQSVQFLLASNPGEPTLPLARIASGGELSRIMLALKKALAADAETCVLVFDEIDTGISGRVADVVGQKLRELASSFQVICISHLPQVAVYADSHFLVRKSPKGNRTETSIVRLLPSESASEIARLLSGDEVSESSLENAQALIGRAREKASAVIRPDR